MGSLSEKADPPASKPHNFKTLKYGIWDVLIPSRTKSSLRGYINDKLQILESFSYVPYFLRLYKDIYNAGRRQFIVYSIYELFQIIERSVAVYCDAKLLDAVSL